MESGGACCRVLERLQVETFDRGIMSCGPSVVVVGGKGARERGRGQGAPPTPRWLGERGRGRSGGAGPVRDGVNESKLYVSCLIPSLLRKFYSLLSISSC